MMDIVKEYIQRSEESLQTYLENMLTNKGQHLFCFYDTDGPHFYYYRRLSDIAVGCKFYVLLEEKKNVFSAPVFKIHDRTVTDIKDGLEPNIKYWCVDNTWRDGTMQTDRIVCLVCKPTMDSHAYMNKVAADTKEQKVTPAPKTRYRWLQWGRDGAYNRYYRCSCCKHEIMIDWDDMCEELELPDSCEHCGAHMDNWVTW